MSSIIIEDIYRAIKSKWWGIPIVAAFIFLILTFTVWNSLPDTVKEELIHDYRKKDKGIPSQVASNVDFTPKTPEQSSDTENSLGSGSQPDKKTTENDLVTSVDSKPKINTSKHSPDTDDSNGSGSQPDNNTTENDLVSVEFKFLTECWVKIADKTGEALAYGIKTEGSVVTLEGIPPIEVTLGDSRCADITVDGEKYDMSRFQNDRTVRFTIPKH